jgi:hypothetical protein
MVAMKHKKACACTISIECGIHGKAANVELVDRLKRDNESLRRQVDDLELMLRREEDKHIEIERRKGGCCFAGVGQACPIHEKRRTQR